MPFHDSRYAVDNTYWDSFFVSIMDDLDIERNLPIWKFMFPEKGGETETFNLLIPSLNDTTDSSNKPLK